MVLKLELEHTNNDCTMF